MRKIMSRLMLVSGLAFSAFGPNACSDSGAHRTAETTGTLSMPLQTTANGHTYRLVNFFIDVFGSSFTSITDTGDPTATSISATLPTGNYTAELFEWTLERENADGTFSPVTSTLESSSFVPFTIFDSTTTTISFRFQTDGIVVTVGAGRLNVDVSVDETQGACTPLGSDCPAGEWCPPADLRGADLACIPAGNVPIAASCASPTDCVANASCFDFGSGPVCAALCSTDGSGPACASGVPCQSVNGKTFGVCSSTPLPGGGVNGAGGAGGAGGSAGVAGAF